MWLMTTRGFYSVVQHRDDPDRVLVRARCKQDIDALRDLVPDAEPIRLQDADYAWRIEVPRAAWAAALQTLLDEVTYPNFKDAVPDKAHKDAYMRVWGVMLALDDR